MEKQKMTQNLLAQEPGPEYRLVIAAGARKVTEINPKHHGREFPEHHARNQLRVGISAVQAGGAA